MSVQVELLVAVAGFVAEDGLEPEIDAVSRVIEMPGVPVIGMDIWFGEVEGDGPHVHVESLSYYVAEQLYVVTYDINFTERDVELGATVANMIDDYLEIGFTRALIEHTQPPEEAKS